jgi:hypothetical protein
MGMAAQLRLVDDNPAVMLFHDRLAHVLMERGDVIHSRGQCTEAKGGYEQVVAMNEQHARENSTDVKRRYALVISMRRRELNLRDLDDFAVPAADTRRALGLCDGLPSSCDLFE